MVLLAGLGYAVGALFLKRALPACRPSASPPRRWSSARWSRCRSRPFAARRRRRWTRVGALFALGAGGTGIAFLIFYTLIADIGPGRASIVAYIAPGFALVYGVALLGEPLTAAPSSASC